MGNYVFTINNYIVLKIKTQMLFVPSSLCTLLFIRLPSVTLSVYEPC
jgi:hypothetical protein